MIIMLCETAVKMLSIYLLFVIFFFNDTATTEIYTLSLHDALPISSGPKHSKQACCAASGKRAPQPRQTSSRAGESVERPPSVDVMRGLPLIFPGARRRRDGFGTCLALASTMRWTRRLPGRHRAVSLSPSG